MKILIRHHLGLGDHVICNGLVRTLAARHQADEVDLMCERWNMPSVAAMYADDPRIRLVPAVNHRWPIDHTGYDAWHDVREHGASRAWDAAFYETEGVPFEHRMSEFKCPRNPERERALFDLLNPAREPFVLVHEHTSSGPMPIPLHTDKLRIGVELYELPGFGLSWLTDWIGMIGQADDIWCVDSSFIHLCISVGATGVLWGMRKPFVGFRLPDSWRRVRS